MAAIHALPDARSGVAGRSIGQSTFVEAQRESSLERHAPGAPPCLDRTAEMPAWLASVAPELAAPERLVPMTADLTQEAILVSESSGKVELCGLLDFGDALIGAAAYDFVSPTTFLVRGRGDLLDALLGGYGWATAARTPLLRRRLMAYSLLHRFSTIGRDTGLLAPPVRELVTLEDALSALWPM